MPEAAATTPVVSVVIPARNAAPSLPGCLDAIAANLREPDPPATEVIVVDDRSSDGTAATARNHPLAPRVVTGEGKGSYAARNAGLAVAAGAVLAFTDADCMPRPGWLAAGVRALQEKDLAGGRIVAPAGPVSPIGRYDRALYLRQEEFVAAQGFAATANLWVRAEVMRSLGGFDSSLLSGGDLEFGLRAGAAGFRLGYAEDAAVEHLPRQSWRELWRLHRRLGAGWAVLARRRQRPPWWRDAALRWPSLGMVVDAVAADGEPLRRRQLAPIHAVAMAARWTGRLTGR